MKIIDRTCRIADLSPISATRTNVFLIMPGDLSISTHIETGSDIHEVLERAKQGGELVSITVELVATPLTPSLQTLTKD